MPSTPPPTSLRTRARTPPTPLHGPQHDTYEPYSPRRSTRSTAHSNPYSSFNGERSPHPHLTTPPQTTRVKKARFARTPTQLSSPPSSPASPIERSRKRSRKANAAAAHSDSEDFAGPSSSLRVPQSIDPITMLPTPSKTPSKKQGQRITSTTAARVLSFQPNHPNDVMPSPRKIKSKPHKTNSRLGFELYDEEVEQKNGGNGKVARGGGIEIYTDPNARVPEVDESEDNPFVGRKVEPRAKKGRAKRSERESGWEGKEMEAKWGREEGVVYVFRGKKIFRPFSSPTNQDLGEASASDVSPNASPNRNQRRLRRQAGPAAQRPLTRSAIKPRLLFPSADQLRERNGKMTVEDMDEEEASTDIDGGVDVEMDGGVEIHPSAAEMATTPMQAKNAYTPGTPPPTTTMKKKRSSPRGRKSFPAAAPAAEVNVLDDATPALPEPEAMDLATEASPLTGIAKAKSPFDSWPRTKGARKRRADAGEEVGSTGGKRSRGGRVGVGSLAA